MRSLEHFRKYLLSSVYSRPDDETGADPETARKAAVEAERAKINVTSVKIEDDEEKEVEAKDDKGDKDKDKDKEDEQEKEDGEEESKKEDNEVEGEKEDDVDEDKEELKAAKKTERLEKKIAREAQKRRDAEKRVRELEAKLEGKEKVLTEDDVKTQAKELARQEKLIEDFNNDMDKLADGVKSHLKISEKKLKELVDELNEETGELLPGVFIGALADLDNGPVVLAHMLKNPDVAEELYKYQKRPTKLGLELAKLSQKLATPKPKKISQVPDAPEVLGGKSAGGDRLAILASKKNLSQDEMAEYVQMRNAEVAKRRANGRMNLR